ncbi:LysR substrate-binding domain-containing protein [Polaromonas sp.]|uniref:LysR substrate-binding domain-containing protein n=1 Tax=Polaromonas sp. TaxID=1869339 RepID=UPI003263209D
MKRHLPPLSALRAFEAAARLGRMTAAAEELSVTPGAISRQVRHLEELLGVPLFEGAKNKPQLTQAGASLLPALTSALDQMEAAVSKVSGAEARTLDVSCFSTFTVKWLIPRLYGFNAQNPGIDIRLSAADDELGADIERYDLVITVEGRDAPKSATSLPLFVERLGPVMAPALAAAAPVREPADLARLPLLRTLTRPDAWQMWCASRGANFAVPDGPAFEHYYFTLEAAVAGLGVAIAPWHLVMDDLRAGRLVAPLGFDESAYQYVAKRRGDADPRLDIFCGWLAQQAREMPVP